MSILFGKTRLAVLGVLFGHPGESFYLRELARATGVGLGAVQREVKKLTEAGVIRRTTRGRQVHYEANRESPIFPELRSLMTKTAGMADLVRSALAPLSEASRRRSSTARWRAARRARAATWM